MFGTRFIVFLSFCCFCYLPSFGQATNNVWAFGWGAGLDFNTTPPTPIFSSIYSLEGVASVSNSAGQLLMYTYGDTVYNSLHYPMPNGGGILGSPTYGSCTQGALIVPRPGSATQYYVFALEGLSDGLLTGRLFYSLVDMALDGGLGDVVVSEKLVQVDTALGEKLTAIAGPCGSIWLLTIPFPYTSNEIHAIEVTASGVSTTPVVSPLPNPLSSGNNYYAGVLKASHNGKKLVAAKFNSFLFEVFDFDNTTGAVSGPILTLPNATMYSAYGACFSPDDSKLYLAYDSVYQYDLTLSSASAIVNSKVALYPSLVSGLVSGDLQNGPDGKIYMATQHGTFLSTIEFPNLLGTACTFIPMSTPLLSPSKSMLGLPNVVVNTGDVSVRNIDTLMCDSLVAKSSSATGPYLWNTGDNTRELTIKVPGKYWVSSFAACGRVDTFNVSVWDRKIVVADTFGCYGKQLQIPVSVGNTAGVSVRWSTGDTAASIILRDTGIYWLSINEKQCFSSDTFKVGYKQCGCEVVLPNAFSPNNDGLNDKFRPVLVGDDCTKSRYLLYVYNRWGQIVYQGYESSEGWNGFYNGAPADVGIYFYLFQFTHSTEKYTLRGDVILLK